GNGRELRAQIPCDCAGTARKTGQTQALGDLGPDPSAGDEAVLQAGVLVVDPLPHRDGLPDLLDLAAHARDACGVDIARDAAGNDRVHQVTVPEERVARPQPVLAQPRELREPESEPGIVAEEAQIPQMLR